jgi:uncharacterized damage-inducible protein DinB
MNINDYRLLAAYNTAVNKEMNGIIQKLTEEQWNKNLDGFYKSLHEVCSHIYIGDYKWFTRFMVLREYTSLNKDFFSKDYSFSDLLFADIQEYLEKRTELDEIITAFFTELTEDDLNKRLQFTNAKGTLVNKKLKTYLIHISHHQTHHRGMISLYLDMIKKENNYSNLYPYGE